MKTAVTEDEKQLLQDLIMDPGWPVFCNKVVSPKMKQYATAAFESIRRNNDDAALLIGKHDAAVEIIEYAYTTAGFEIPEHFKNVRKNV